VVNSLVRGVDVQAMVSEMIASNDWGTTAGRRNFGETCEKKGWRLLHDNASTNELALPSI